MNSKFKSEPWWLTDAERADRAKAREACRVHPEPESPEISADGGYIVPVRFVDHLRGLLA